MNSDSSCVFHVALKKTKVFIKQIIGVIRKYYFSFLRKFRVYFSVLLASCEIYSQFLIENRFYNKFLVIILNAKVKIRFC